jgi:hypothetical protein
VSGTLVVSMSQGEGPPFVGDTDKGATPKSGKTDKLLRVQQKEQALDVERYLVGTSAQESDTDTPNTVVEGASSTTTTSVPQEQHKVTLGGMFGHLLEKLGVEEEHAVPEHLQGVKEHPIRIASSTEKVRPYDAEAEQFDDETANLIYEAESLEDLRNVFTTRELAIVYAEEGKEPRVVDGPHIVELVDDAIRTRDFLKKKFPHGEILTGEPYKVIRELIQSFPDDELRVKVKTLLPIDLKTGRVHATTHDVIPAAPEHTQDIDTSGNHGYLGTRGKVKERQAIYNETIKTAGGVVETSAPTTPEQGTVDALVEQALRTEEELEKETSAVPTTDHEPEPVSLDDAEPLAMVAKEVEQAPEEVPLSEEVRAMGEAQDTSSSEPEPEEVVVDLDGTEHASAAVQVETPHGNEEQDMFTASVPVMITQAMRKQLRELGHPDTEIATLRPEEAWEILKEGSVKGVDVDPASVHPVAEQGEEKPASLEELSVHIKDAARAYAQARYHAQQKLKESAGFLGKIGHSFGLIETHEEDIEHDQGFKDAEARLFAVREQIEQGLDVRVAERLAQRKSELTDEWVREKILRADARYQVGEVPRVVTGDEIQAYRAAYETRMASKVEQLKHVLRYEHINAPLRELRLEVEQQQFETDFPGKNLLAQAVLWYRGDRSTFVSRQKVVARNALITSTALAAGAVPLLGAGAAVYFGMRVPTKLFSSLVGAEVGLAASKGVGALHERVLTKDRTTALAQAREQAKQGTEEGRQQSIKEVFRAEEGYDRGQKRKVLYQGVAGAVVGGVAGIETNAAFADTTPLSAGVVHNTLPRVEGVGVPGILEHVSNEVQDYQDLVTQFLEDPAKAVTEGVSAAKGGVAEAAHEFTHADMRLETSVDEVTQELSPVHDAVPSEKTTTFTSVPHEPTPTKLHLEGAYERGESVEKILVEKLEDTHPELSRQELGVVAHQVVEEIRDNAAIAKGFGVEDGAWNQVEQGEVYNVDIDQSIIEDRIQAVRHTDVSPPVQEVAPPHVDEVPAVAHDTTPEGIQESGHAPVPHEQGSSAPRTPQARMHELLYPGVAADLERAQGALPDWSGNKTRPYLDQLFKSDLMSRDWVQANKPLIQSNWGIIGHVKVRDIFDATPGLRYTVDGVPVTLSHDTERYVLTFMHHLETTPGAQEIVMRAQKEGWAIADLVQAVLDKKQGLPIRGPIESLDVPAQVDVPTTSIPEPIKTSGIVRTYYNDGTPLPHNTSTPEPITPGPALHPAPGGSLGGGRGGYGRVGYGTVVAGDTMAEGHMGPVAVGGGVHAEISTPHGNVEHVLPSRPTIPEGALRDQMLASKFSFDRAEVAAILKDHPGWEGKTFGQLMASDAQFGEVWKQATNDVVREYASYDGQGVPKRLITIEQPAPDTNAEDALLHIKQLESQMQHNRRYSLQAHRHPFFRR